MNYNQSIKYIHSVSNFFCRPGVERIKTLCKQLGNPQDKLKFIHVAGTNGKGSFCSMLSNILIKAGYTTGTYTSPFILKFNERISVNGKNIENSELAEITSAVKTVCENMDDKPTEFEIITAVAFEYFYRKQCDVVVLECGLGGRFDATNIVKTSLISVITGIALDHQNFLGNTEEEIAYEKAGIIKSTVPCLWCGNSSQATEVISKTAAEHNSEFFTPQLNELKILSSDLSGTYFNYKNHQKLFIPLLGLYQPYNAVNVVEAVEILQKKGFCITEQNIYEGLKTTVWKARFELLSKKPTVIFDGAHNPQGITSCVNSIKHYFGNTKVNILTGVMADKDYTFMANEISSIAEKVYCVKPENPRALDAEKYAETFRKSGINALSFEHINDAVKTAVEECKKSSLPLVCLGSLYMYSDVYKFFV